MPQVITIECSTCESVEKEKSERCLMIIWRGENIGIFRHDIDTEDILTAMKELLKCYQQELVNQAQRN